MMNNCITYIQKKIENIYSKFYFIKVKNAYSTMDKSV